MPDMTLTRMNRALCRSQTSFIALRCPGETHPFTSILCSIGWQGDISHSAESERATWVAY
ncbi:hypothetical protein BDV10DRAFT_122855 [Aspergillus recurvatus]